MTTNKDEIELGATYQDELTGATGRAVAVSYVWRDVTQVCLQPTRVNPDGKPVESTWLEAWRLVGR